MGRPLIFGVTQDGHKVEAIRLSGHGLTVTVLTLGAILQDVRLDGVAHGLTLGSDRLADYEGDMRYHGSIVGPVVNRLSGASVPIGGRVVPLEVNFHGRHNIHSGSAGTHLKVWRVVERNDATLTLQHELVDGEGGFPGNRIMTATFSLLPSATLRLSLTTTTDAPSIVNATNHSYWNLDGSDHLGDHTLRIDADRYLPADEIDLVTGEIADVAGMTLDFRAARRLTPGDPPLDNTFCVADQRGPLRPWLTLQGESGVTLNVSTTEPGVHVYDGRAAARPGRPFSEGLAIECQGWPDAPNHPQFPSIDVTPDAPVTQVTEWRFSKA